MYNDDEKWEEINAKKRIEITIAQATNLAAGRVNALHPTELPQERMETYMDIWFKFYFAFLKKQHDKIFPKPKKLLDHKEIYTKKADGEHIENCNYDDDTI